MSLCANFPLSSTPCSATISGKNWCNNFVLNNNFNPIEGFSDKSILFSSSVIRSWEIIDPFAGISDLETKTIKTPLNPDVTYSDDPLRMMRAIRFSSELNFEIENESYSSICKNADRLSINSP